MGLRSRIIAGSLELAGPGVGQQSDQQNISRQEIEGDTANPGTAETAIRLGRSLGQPQSKEDKVLSDGWPFRMSEMNEIQQSPIEVAAVNILTKDCHRPNEVGARF